MFLVLMLMATSANADNRIIGKWQDKGNPDQSYTFENGNEFTFAYSFVPVRDSYVLGQGTTKKHVVYKGVWETGNWTLTTKTNGKVTGEEQCHLTIYAGEDQCCFDYKFIGNNLVLTNVYKTSAYARMCNNRVLVKYKQ